MRMISLRSEDLSHLHKFLKLCATNTFALMFARIPNPCIVFILTVFYSPNLIVMYSPISDTETLLFKCETLVHGI